MAENHGFPEHPQNAAAEKYHNAIPGGPSGSMHGSGVLGEPTFETAAMRQYGPVQGGQKGHPGTD